MPAPAKIGPAKAIAKAEHSELIDLFAHYDKMGKEWVKRQVLVNNRIDILATYVLGYETQPFHIAMMKHQFLHVESLILAFRGSGKSTVCDITKIIHMLLVNPNLRILIASKVIGQSETFLKEIKAHFESNTKLEEIFGAYYDPRKVTKWDSREIEVLPRTSIAKEGSITCVGVGGMVVGRHYDVIISDDLVDEANSATQLQRDKVKSWFYSTLMPTLDPPDPKVPFRGQHHMLGTRYHYADLYGHLLGPGGEMEKSTLRVPALSPDGQSPWPSRWPAERFAEIRRRAGLIIFNAQYQVDTEAMKGEIFAYDDCVRIADSEIPKELRIYMGIDLAISEKDTADKFAIVVLGMDRDKKYYVLYYFEGQLRFSAQTAKIKEVYRDYDPIRCYIETNAYQEAQYQELKDSDADIRIIPYDQEKDKIARAWKLSPIFENKRMHFRANQHDLIEHLVLFPNHRYKDLFDAMDLAVRASKKKRRRTRRGDEPGLI